MRATSALLVTVAAFMIASAGRAAWWKAQPDETALSLPTSLDQAQADWEVTGSFQTVEDPILGRKVLETTNNLGWIRSRKAFSAPYELAALVRLTKPASDLAGLYTDASSNPAAPQFTYRLSITYGEPYGLGFYPTIGPTMTNLAPPAGAIKLPDVVWMNRAFTKISPVWEENYRREIESAMAAVLPFEDTWMLLRVVADGRSVRMYRDGFLLGEHRPGLLVNGPVALRTTAGMRVASLTVQRLDPSAAAVFHPVALDDRCNAAAVDAKTGLAIRAASLPPAGATVAVRDIPFTWSRRLQGPDHVDIGASLFHQRLQPNGWDMNPLWPAPNLLDGGRLTFSLPNRPYSRLWLIAASDGETNSVPMITARFYKPGAGFTIDRESEVPLLTAASAPEYAQPLDVKTADGRDALLWLIRLDLDANRIASEMREFSTLSLELTKKVYPYRAFPDPAGYGYFQGGLPSAARVFAMTLEEAPVFLLASGTRPGNVFVLPETPVWQATIVNGRNHAIDGRVKVTFTDPYGKLEATQEQAVMAPARNEARATFPFSPARSGRYSVRTEFAISKGAGDSDPAACVRQDYLVQVSQDTRVTDQNSSHWGLWCWYGGHDTNPDPEANAYLMRACGARGPGPDDVTLRQKWGLFPRPMHLPGGAFEWAFKEPYDPADYQKVSDEAGKTVAEDMVKNPDGRYYTFFTETSISMEATYGTYPEYLGAGPRQWTDAEKKSIRASTVSAKAVFEGIRKAAPKAKISLGWCHPQFVIPLLREKFPANLFDAIGVDTPNFERMPEMPATDISANKMWFLHQEMHTNGYADKTVIHTESYFPSSHELALGHRVAADYTVRMSVLSLALGSDKLMNCYTLHDCASYWGAQHYGCIGLIGRRPEFNPKPAYPAFATMTRMLDLVDFDGYAPAGSVSAYCVRFKNKNANLPHRFVQCLWTIRGQRLATVVFATNAVATLVDENGNETPVATSNQTAAVILTPSPFWVTSDQPVASLTLGEPTYTEAPEGPVCVLDPLDEPWTCDPGDYPRYSSNWPTLNVTFPAPMKSEIVDSPARTGKVWKVSLLPQEKERPAAAFFAVYRPKAPLPIPGKARALGLWVRGFSDWGRILYEIQDAKGETFLSAGTKEDWNCNDVHQWSYFNFDGWRYLEFPLPNNAAGDDYREKDTVWWGSDQDGITDLPVKLTRIVVEHRTHHVYVHEMVKLPDPTVEMDSLMAVYEDAAAMTDEPVRLQQAARIRPSATQGQGLPNPVVKLAADGVGTATQVERVYKPDFYDGTQIMTQLMAVPGATEYRVYVSAYESGAGADVIAKGKDPVLQLSGLRPSFPLFLFVTYVDKDGKESKPSAAKRIFLANDFPNK